MDRVTSLLLVSLTIQECPYDIIICGSHQGITYTQTIEVMSMGMTGTLICGDWLETWTLQIDAVTNAAQQGTDRHIHT